jgi:uncharacterized pyridoxal phosphate-containing UPF0001 family protein
VLLEVNLAGEGSKAGVSQDELPAILSAAAGMPGILVKGLMAIPPMTDDPEDSRPHFSRLREIMARLPGHVTGGEGMTELSMGMSNDFEVAIEEGATMVRVGTAVFGSRYARRG